MPNANGRIKGISTQGIKNEWLDSVSTRETQTPDKPPAPAPHEEIPYGTWGDPITIGGSCGD